MNILVAVTVTCFFILHSAPLPVDAIDQGRLYKEIQAKLPGVEHLNKQKNNLSNPIVSVTEAFGVYYTINSHSDLKQKNTATTPNFTPSKFDPTIPSWIVLALDGGNGLNGVLAGIINQAYGGQTVIVATPSTKEEMEKAKKTMDGDDYQRKEEISKYFTDLLESAEKLGITVIKPTNTENVDSLWKKFSTEHDDINFNVVVDALIGKGFEDKPIGLQAVPSFEVLQELKYKFICGVDGASAGSIANYTGDNDELMESKELVVASDFVIMLYGFSGWEANVLTDYYTADERVFLLTNDKVEEAIKEIDATYAIKHKANVVSYDDSLNTLDNSFYKNIPDKLESIVKSLNVVTHD